MQKVDTDLVGLQRYTLACFCAEVLNAWGVTAHLLWKRVGFKIMGVGGREMKWIFLGLFFFYLFFLIFLKSSQ